MWFGCASEIGEPMVTPTFEIILDRIEEGDVAFKRGDYSEALDFYSDAESDLQLLLEIQEDRYVEGQYRVVLSMVQRKIQLAQIGREISSSSNEILLFRRVNNG